jgi:hypothetical protein
MGERLATFGPILVVLALLSSANEARAQQRARDSYEEAAMAGFASTSDYLGVGPAVAFELGRRHQLDDFSVGVALRAQYERYSSAGAGACSTAPPSLSGACTRNALSFPYTFDETLVTFELPLTARLGSSSPRELIFPYAGIAPGLVYDRSNTAAGSGLYSIETSARFSVHGFAGTQLRLGPGGVFFEWGFRVAPVEHRAEIDSHLTSFVGSLGYRLTL